MSDAVEHELGPYAMIPLWLLETLIDARSKALPLYVALHKWTNGADRSCYPSRQTLAKYLGVSVDTVDRWSGDLQTVGAITVERRFTDDGDPTSNLYTLRVVRPGSRTDAATGGGTDAATPSRTDAALTKPSSKQTQLEASVAAEADDSPAHQLCEQLADHIEQLGAKRPVITNAWLQDMDRAIRIDQRTPDQLANCIRWLSTPNRDAQFWSTNILSPKKLRANFDKMALQARASKTPQRNPTPIEQARAMRAERKAISQ